MAWFSLAIVLCTIFIRADFSVLAGKLAPTDSNNTVRAKLEDFTKESDGTPSNSSKPAKETLLQSLISVDDSDSNATSALYPNSSLNETSLQSKSDCKEEGVNSTIRAVVLSFCSEVILCVLYFTMTDWTRITHMRRVVISSLLVASSSLCIFFSLTSPDKDRWAIITTYIYCTILTLYVNLGASLSDVYLSHLKNNNVVTVVGDEIRLRKPWRVGLDACGFQLVMAGLSGFITLAIEKIIKHPCQFTFSEHLSLSNLPVIYYFVWLVLALIVYDQLLRRQAKELKQPFSLEFRIYYIGLVFCFIFWNYGMMIITEGIHYGWIITQFFFLCCGLNISLLDKIRIAR